MKKQILAVIAHDTKKEELIRLLRAFKPGLSAIDIVATRSTGQMIQSRIGLPVTLVYSGWQGGDIQIGAMVAAGDVTAVIFLRDSYTSFADESIMTTLLRMCDIHEVPLATNLATAAAVLYQITEPDERPGPHEIVADYLDEIATIHE